MLETEKTLSTVAEFEKEIEKSYFSYKRVIIVKEILLSVRVTTRPRAAEIKPESCSFKTTGSIH
jgi:hypothetical protein